MKIGFVYNKFPLYAGGSHIYDFILELSKCFESIVVVSARFPDVEVKVPSNVRIVWVPSNKNSIINDIIYIFFSFFYMFVSKEFRKVDLVNVVCSRGAFSAKLFCFLLQKPIVCTVELVNDPRKSIVDSIFYFIQKVAYSKIKYDKIICWSKYHYLKYLYKWGVNKNNVVFISNGINSIQKYDINKIKSLHNKYAKGKILIVFAKPLYMYNKIAAELLLKSVAVLKDDNIVILMGKGEYENEIITLSHKLGIDKNVKYMPFVPMTEIGNYIRASDIIVLPYLYEATVSRSLLESMIAGKAIVITKVGEIPYILRNEVNALIVKPTKRQIAKSITKLLNDKALRKKLGKNAREEALLNYSMESVAVKTVNLFNKVLVDKNIK
ncbi:MAG: glycosyltransferase family 4 protein [Candidatus Roizmanbacteria bacterium]|nr:glycosyltransferase family 4 protein [Candidatus Roizmanbacteria bacterium]